jgi:MoxR-like ATPase
MNLSVDAASDSEYAKLAAKLRSDVLEPIKQRLVGKDEIIEVLGVALASGENTFLLGPPGTGKSALVQELAARLSGRSFDYLLTRFTEPSELFGPFDLRRLKEGDLVTNTEGMLPEADFVFLDELLNANSAILNSLLLALNERIFRRGRETVPLPMLLAVGASNRLPDDDALGALFDRFLLRVGCDNVDSDGLEDVLEAGWRREQSRHIDVTMQIEDVRKLIGHTTRVNLSGVRGAYLQLVRRLREAGMPLSDRRAVRLQRVVAASAVLCGRETADVSDLWVMRYIWDTPAQSEMLAAHVTSITKDFSGELTTSELQRHPLSDSTSGADPERLSDAINAIVSDADNPASLDQLSLIAARVEWVGEDVARDHLRQKIAEAREILHADESPGG